MRLTQLFGMSMSLSFVLLAACGDDGGKKQMIIDAPGGGNIDAPGIDAPRTCLLPATIGMGGLGTMAAPKSGNFIIKTAATANPPNAIFFGLKLSFDMTGKTAITIIVPRPAAGFTAGVNNFDGTAAIAFLEGGLDAQGMNATQTLDATNGSITFSAIGQNMGNPITATVGATNFAEVDDQDNPIAGGCTSSLAGLKLFLTQMTTVSAPTGPNNPGHPETWKLQVGDLPAQIYTVE